MHARRRHADHDIAFAHVGGARQDVPALHRADREAREIEIALGIEAGHLRRLAADQRAARFPARMRDALDHDGRRFDIQLAARVIVQKEQRLRALHDDVVHAHRNQILADAAEQAGLDRDLELGADAIGRGDQNRIAEPRGLQVEQSAEPAERRVRAGPSRGFRGGRNARHEFLARIDIDAGVFIGQMVASAFGCHSISGATEVHTRIV